MPTVPQAGVTPISAFFVGTSGVPAGAVVAILADPIDPATGEYLSISRGFDPVDAAFFVAMRTVRASGSAVENVGQRFADHKLIDDQLDSFMREEVRLASKDLVDSGDLEVDNVTVDKADVAATTTIEWQNLARQKARKVALPANMLLGAAP